MYTQRETQDGRWQPSPSRVQDDIHSTSQKSFEQDIYNINKMKKPRKKEDERGG